MPTREVRGGRPLGSKSGNGPLGHVVQAVCSTPLPRGHFDLRSPALRNAAPTFETQLRELVQGHRSGGRNWGLEIGHHVLHVSYLTNNVHVDKIVLNRDELSSQGLDTKEIEANAFAAELLMPEAELRRYRTIDLNDDEFMLRLAKKLRVSVTALTYRVINLRMI